MKSCSSSFDFTLSTDVSIAPPPKKCSRPERRDLAVLYTQVPEFHPDIGLLGFTSAGDEWLFEGCTVSLKEASQKRQLWIVKVLTVSSLMATVSVEFSLGMYKMNLSDFNV